MKHVELLSPAGDINKLKYAIQFGADAVYLGMPDFSLRVRVNKFDKKSLKEAVEYAHQRKKKAYITLNIYAHNKHLPQIEKHLKFLRKLEIDGVIISDPGIINLAKKYLPKTDIHLSTQANATNWQAVKFWKDIGVRRIILAREVALSEIREIRKKVPGIELEYFVHGAMCMSYSGRCILSKWMTNRSANLGDCSQPCRWKYKTANSDQKTVNKKEIRIKDNQNKYEINVEEDQHGTYFFNSYDMNSIEHVKDLVDAGVTSLKIEGRAKSAYYVSVVTRSYRKVIDAMGSKNSKKVLIEQKQELDKLTHRGYSTGFLLGTEPPHNFDNKKGGGEYKFVGEVVGLKNNLNEVSLHNEIFLNDKLECVIPEGNFPARIKKIFDTNQEEVREAHGGHKNTYYFQFDKILPMGGLLRKK